MSNIKQRDYWFDNAKAFLIILVFMGHICECLIRVVPFENGTPSWLSSIFEFIYMFHMPAFMIISGRFAKGRIDRNDWITSINKLIIPYIVIQCIMLLFYCFVGYTKVTVSSFFVPGYGLWYILVLGIYQIITPHILKLFKNKWLLLPISIILVAILAFQHKVPPAPTMRIINFFPFFVLGYLTADKNFDFCKKVFFRILSALAFCGILVAINFDSILNITLFSGKRVYGQFYELFGFTGFEFLLAMAVRYLLGFAFFFFLLGICSTKKLFATTIGTNSTYIYILHLFIIVALTSYGRTYGILNFCTNEAFAVLILILTIPISFLLISNPVMKATRWLVSPNFNLKNIVEKIIK